MGGTCAKGNGADFNIDRACDELQGVLSSLEGLASGTRKGFSFIGTVAVLRNSRGDRLPGVSEEFFSSFSGLVGIERTKSGYTIKEAGRPATAAQNGSLCEFNSGSYMWGINRRINEPNSDVPKSLRGQPFVSIHAKDRIYDEVRIYPVVQF